MKETDDIKKLYITLLSQNKVNFPPLGTKVNETASQGVYVIKNERGMILYVGRTTRRKSGLNGRLDRHRLGYSSFATSYLDPKNLKIDTTYTFQYLGVEDARKRALLEALTIGKLCPAYVGTGEKKK